MEIVKMIGVILLAVYLILSGLATLTGFLLNPVGLAAIQLLALASGILLLISIGSCCSKDKR